MATTRAPSGVRRRRAPPGATARRADAPSGNQGPDRRAGGGDRAARCPRPIPEHARQPPQPAWGDVAAGAPCRDGVPAPVRSVSAPTVRRDLSSLTAREEDVAALLARGQTNRQIAAALGLGEGTVKGHVGHIRAKQHLHSRAEALAWARARAGAL